jgi:hypothetical protein
MRAGVSDEQARQMGLPFMVLQQEVTQSVLRQAATAKRYPRQQRSMLRPN